MRVVQEEIFAVAYNVVGTSYRVDRNAPGYIKKTPIAGGPKRAKAHHPSLGDDSDKEEVEIEEETIQDLGGICFQTANGEDELTRNQFSGQGSFSLE
jgi:hypothetical protein